ncbi:hypothetical protein BKA69DRAFT_594390 [Paraphysoderma sedebokerense]|nr:hypothetical protein BKA69DRAFT_594390 [Paraphysoderma sedebokerense]
MMWLLLAVISVVSTLATTQTFVPTGYHSSAQIGTKLYVFGGYTVKGNDGYNQITTQVAVLDLSKEFSPQSLPTWVLKSSMPKAIMGGQVDIDSSKALIYLWGGIVSEKADNPQGHAEVANKVVYKYSIAEDKWSVVENTTGNGRVWPCENRLAVPNSRRLFFGGKRDIGPVNDPTHSEICFLESGNVKCNPGPKGPSPRLSGVFHEVKPQNYLLFSGSEGDMTFADVWTFDADSFSWTLQAATISNRSSVSSILCESFSCIV